MSPPHEIELEAGTVRLREDGIMHTVLARNWVITVDDVRAMFNAAQTMRSAPTPALTDIRGTRSTDMLAVRFTAGEEVARMTSKHAVLVDSPVSRMIGNVFMGMWKPSYPTRLFTDEDAAVAWLLADPTDTAASNEDDGRGVDDEPAA